MHIGRHIVQELVLRFGSPAVERWSFPMKEGEFAELKRITELGRGHDVSLCILRGDELATIRKPSYPPDAFRVPSGGVHPEESFVDGATREALEETGLEIEIEGYPLYILVTFTHQDESVKWASHVLRARPVGGELRPLDTDEIAAARWIGWKELLGEVNSVLRDSGLGGLAYRARLHDRAYELLVGGQEKANC